MYTCPPSWASLPLPPYPIPQGHPSAPALSTLSHVLNWDWWSISHMVIYMFQCYSFKKHVWDNFTSPYVKVEYPDIVTKTLKSLLPFPTSHLCEARLSAVTATQMRLWNRQDMRNTLQVSLSPITHKWDCLVATKQAQGSHWFWSMVSCIIMSSYTTVW